MLNRNLCSGLTHQPIEPTRMSSNMNIKNHIVEPSPMSHQQFDVCNALDYNSESFCVESEEIVDCDTIGMCSMTLRTFI